jgi:undecaprenyl diphosphate synthase
MAEASHSWPAHVAVIMDGNGRWAKQRNLPRIEGHRAGIKSVQSVVESCRTLGIRYLTLYAFSVENWKRPRNEISGLMALLYDYLASEIPRLHRDAVRLRAIGQLNRLPRRVSQQFRRIMEKTASHRELTLILALSYGGRTEILDAVRKIAKDRKKGKEQGGEVTPEILSRHLYAPDVPPPDLLIRTSGERRLSNFLLWESARSQLYFAPQMWPDFGGEQFEKVIMEARKTRKSGKRIEA